MLHVNPLMMVSEKGYKNMDNILKKKEEGQKTQDIVGEKNKLSPKIKQGDLLEAVKKNNIHEVSRLLNNGSDVNEVDNKGRSALMCAIAICNERIIDMLIDKNARINAKDNKGRSVLMYALAMGDEKIVNALIDKNAEVNAKDIKGRTVLMYAIKGGKASIINRLIQKGADKNEKDEDNKNVLMYALEKGSNMSFIIDDMLKEANTRLIDKKGRDLLMYACQGGYMKAVVDLTEKGTELYAVDNKKMTALGIAFSQKCKQKDSKIKRQEYIEITKYLMSKGSWYPGDIHNKAEFHRFVKRLKYKEEGLECINRSSENKGKSRY